MPGDDFVGGAVRRVMRAPGRFLALTLLLTTAAALLLPGLRVRSSFTHLLPPEHPAVVALRELESTVGGENTASVLIASPLAEANRRFAEDLIPQILAARPSPSEPPFFTAVDYRRDPTFLENNALYLATDAEIARVVERLETKIEDASMEANPFVVDLVDDLEALAEDEGEEADLEEIYDRIVPREYPENDDGTLLVLRVYVSGSQGDLDFIATAYAALDAAVQKLNPTDYNPHMTVDLGGRVRRQLVEVGRVTNDLRTSFGIGILMVLGLVLGFLWWRWYRYGAAGDRIAAFRAALASLLILAAPLFMSLVWAGGYARLRFGQLNLLTSTLGLVLFGLGIDYSLHLHSRYIDHRGAGVPPRDAMDRALGDTGPAIVGSAATTAIALLSLTLARFRGFSEFGEVAGVGILFAALATLLAVPGLTLYTARWSRPTVPNTPVPAPSIPAGHRFGAVANLPVRYHTLITVFAAVGLLAAAGGTRRLGFEFDFGALQPRFPQLLELVRREQQVYPPSGRNPAYVVAESALAAESVAATLREVAERDTDSPTIASVELLQDRFPITPAAQRDRLDRLQTVRDLLQDPMLASESSDELSRLGRAASTTAPIAIQQVPDYLRRRFTAKDESVGRLVLVYPREGLADGRAAMRFYDDVGAFVGPDGRGYRAASTSLVSAAMLGELLEDAPQILALSAAAILATMLVVFRSITWAALALLPLAVGAVYTAGIAGGWGLNLNFYNLVVLPAILGIGNDCGVHIVQRYRRHGPGSLPAVMRSTGPPIVVGALTTMIGFGGLLLSFQPGLVSMGQLAVVGIGSTLLAALVPLPAFLAWRETVPNAARRRR